MTQFNDDERKYSVYRVFDEAGQLLYVGCTCDLKRRWSEHRTQRPEIALRAKRFRVQGPFVRSVARRLERAAAETEHPLYGWTPIKQALIQRRDRWITRRSDELVAKGGWDFWAAHRMATDEAVGRFGEPVTYYAPWQPTQGWSA